MSVQVVWDNPEQTIVRYIFEGYWNWEEFFAAVTTAKSMIDSAPGKVGVIMDGTSGKARFPPHMLTHLRNALRHKHPKTVIVVVIINDAFLGMMVKTLTTIAGSAGKSIKMADTLDQARQIVQLTISDQ